MAKEIFKHDGKQVYGSDFASVVKSVDSDKRTITFIASDESVDRDGDIIKIAGWDLSNYIKKSGDVVVTPVLKRAACKVH